MTKLVVLSNYDELSRACAQVLVRVIRQRPCSVVGLPTGTTPLGMYRELVDAHRRGEVDFSKITAFNLDEYIGLRTAHPASFSAYMEANFWKYIPLDPARRHIPASMPVDPIEECVRYETAIQDAGGLDFTILGLGTNGHIGFNEPGTPWDTTTHVAALTKSTIAYLDWEVREETCPTQAITMGIRTILSSRVLMLIVNGPDKAYILERALAGPTGIDCPASSLQLHPCLLVMVDRSAGRKLMEKTEGVGGHRVVLTSGIEESLADLGIQ